VIIEQPTTTQTCSYTTNVVSQGNIATRLRFGGVVLLHIYYWICKRKNFANR